MNMTKIRLAKDTDMFVLIKARKSWNFKTPMHEIDLDILDPLELRQVTNCVANGRLISETPLKVQPIQPQVKTPSPLPSPPPQILPEQQKSNEEKPSLYSINKQRLDSLTKKLRMPTDELIDQIEHTNSMSELKSLLAMERKNRKRRGIINLLMKKLKQFEKEVENSIKKEAKFKNPDKINGDVVEFEIVDEIVGRVEIPLEALNRGS
jgi:hypothetical protein